MRAAIGAIGGLGRRCGLRHARARRSAGASRIQLVVAVHRAAQQWPAAHALRRPNPELCDRAASLRARALQLEPLCRAQPVQRQSVPAVGGAGAGRNRPGLLSRAADRKSVV